MDSCRGSHLQQTASPHSCHTLWYLSVPADAKRAHCEVGSYNDIANLPQTPGWTLSKWSFWLTLYIWVFFGAYTWEWIPCTAPTSFYSPLPFFFSLPPSAFLSTLSLQPYSTSISQHCINISSKNWALRKINLQAKRKQKYLIHKQAGLYES